jgi:phenylacetate-CoA ligase
MPDYYDRYERRGPRAREAALFRDLRAVLGVAKARAPNLRSQLKGIEIDRLKTRADLAHVPVLRKADLLLRQSEVPPFGGACATRPAALQHLLMSPDHSFQPAGPAKDWWNVGRALFAAGIRKGDIVLNCFSYHFTPEGHMMDCGLRALGCPIIAAGNSDVDATLAVIDHYGPVAYCGPADFLKRLVARRTKGKGLFETVKCAVFGSSLAPPPRKSAFAAQDCAVFEAYLTPDLGVVAYESENSGGLIVNEGLIVEIVHPGTNEPLPTGETGEIVVTRLNVDYPLLRFATGDFSAMVEGPSPCGRTNMRIMAPIKANVAESGARSGMKPTAA